MVRLLMVIVWLAAALGAAVPGVQSRVDGAPRIGSHGADLAIVVPPTDYDARPSTDLASSDSPPGSPPGPPPSSWNWSLRLPPLKLALGDPMVVYMDVRRQPTTPSWTFRDRRSDVSRFRVHVPTLDAAPSTV